MFKNTAIYRAFGSDWVVIFFVCVYLFFVIKKQNKTQDQTKLTLKLYFIHSYYDTCNLSQSFTKVSSLQYLNPYS